MDEILEDNGVSDLQIEITQSDNVACIALRGEADIATLARLRDGLAHVGPGSTVPVQIHVVDLAFCDVASLRQLARFAQELRQAGRAVTTCDPKPIVRKLAGMLGAADDLGIS